MSPVGKYFDNLDERIKTLESGINSLSKDMAELISYFAAAPAARSGVITPADKAKTGPEKAGENPAENPGNIPGDAETDKPTNDANHVERTAEKPTEISEEKEIPLESKESEKTESRPESEAVSDAPAAAPQVERATSTSKPASDSDESEKSAAPAAARVERAISARGEAPEESDFETLRPRVAKIIRGDCEGASDIAAEFRNRITAGTLWPVSLCTTWAQFDQLKNFLDAKGV